MDGGRRMRPLTGRYVAALDDSAAATPVLQVARELAARCGGSVEAVHVAEDGGSTARAVCERQGVELHVLRGPVVESLCRVVDDEDVAAVVIGARRATSAKREAGHVATALVTRSAKPVVVVPPHLRMPFHLDCVLVPMERSRATAEALGGAIRTFCARGLRIVLLHVHEHDAVPPFADQPQHDTPAWIDEFVARYAPDLGDAGGVELRVGSAPALVLPVAHETGADLLLLAWSRDLSPGRAAVVRQVLAAAAIPVVLVPVAGVDAVGIGSRR